MKKYVLFCCCYFFFICVQAQWKPEGNKIITISILKSIEPGLGKEEFLNILENNIYSELDKIN